MAHLIQRHDFAEAGHILLLLRCATARGKAEQKHEEGRARDRFQHVVVPCFHDILRHIVSQHDEQSSSVRKGEKLMMRLIRRRLAWFCFVTVIMTGSLLAHHSFAVYDHTKTLTLKGTVTRWQWSNPHAYLDIDIREASGTTKHFTLEGTSINMLQRMGWRSNMIKAGDQVTAVAAPLLNGDPGGLLLEITLANGEKKELPVPAAGTFKRTPDQN